MTIVPKMTNNYPFFLENYRLNKVVRDNSDYNIIQYKLLKIFNIVNIL